MLEHYFTHPRTIDRLRASWLAEPIERCVSWKRELGYSSSTIRCRVEVQYKFGEFAWRQGARNWNELPEQVLPFVYSWEQNLPGPPLGSSRKGRHRRLRVQTPIEEMIACVVPGFQRSVRRTPLTIPFSKEAPEFFSYLRNERGLSESTIRHQLHYLRRFKRYLESKSCDLNSLSPEVFREFIAQGGRGLSIRSVAALSDSLRGFLRYLHRENILPKDLSATVERPRLYRLAHVPRSIPWEETQRLLSTVDRRSAAGRRDFAILVLLVTGKGDKWRECPLWSETAEQIRELVKARGCEGEPEAPVFVSRRGEPLTRFGIYKIVRRHTAALDAPALGTNARRITPHVVRHTTAVHLLESGVELNVIRAWLGHASLTSKHRYAEVTARLKEAALKRCEVPIEATGGGFPRQPRWRTDKALLDWLDSL